MRAPATFVVTPDSRLIEGTVFYKHGQKVSDAVFGPLIPCHLDPE
jgi:hypothetical protein